MKDMERQRHDNELARARLARGYEVAYYPEGEGFGRTWGDNERKKYQQLSDLNDRMMVPSGYREEAPYSLNGGDMGRYPQSDFLEEIENDPRRLLQQGQYLPSMALSEILAGDEYERPDFEYEPREIPPVEAVSDERDWRPRGVEGEGRIVPPREIPSTGIDFMPEGMEKRFRRPELSPDAQRAFAFPVEEGETTFDARRRALRELEEAMTPEQRLEYQIRKHNFLRKQRMR